MQLADNVHVGEAERHELDESPKALEVLVLVCQHHAVSSSSVLGGDVTRFFLL